MKTSGSPLSSCGRTSQLHQSNLSGSAGSRVGKRWEDELAAALMQRRTIYLGAQYRWGGKTPLGIDCSGLVSMAYLLSGVIIYRDAAIKPGFALHEISFEQQSRAICCFPRPRGDVSGRGTVCSLHRTYRYRRRHPPAVLRKRRRITGRI